MGNDIIDFRSERGRHEELLGREDILAELDRLLGRGGDTRGWVLVKGGPGMGKSALLAHYLARLEREGQRVPHHFLRRGVQGWDRPEVVARNLAAQVEALFPEQAQPDARPESRLQENLQRVSDGRPARSSNGKRPAEPVTRSRLRVSRACQAGAPSSRGTGLGLLSRLLTSKDIRLRVPPPPRAQAHQRQQRQHARAPRLGAAAGAATPHSVRARPVPSRESAPRPRCHPAATPPPRSGPHPPSGVGRPP